MRALTPEQKNRMASVGSSRERRELTAVEVRTGIAGKE
jgi:hypothetical protein